MQCMKKLNKNWIDLVKDGVLEPIETSDWAAPIVAVLKYDKTNVQICVQLLL